MSDGGFGVHTDDMRAHAGHLRGVVDRIGVARDAAGQVSLNGTDAYGVLCSPILTPLLGAVETSGMSAIAAADGAVEATATGVEGMADSYDALEEQLDGMFRKIIDELGKRV